MLISDDEARNLIETLITKYAPPGLDKMNVLEKLEDIDKALFQVPKRTKICPDCGLEMFCRKCSRIDISYDVDVTVRADGVEICSG